MTVDNSPKFFASITIMTTKIFILTSFFRGVCCGCGSGLGGTGGLLFVTMFDCKGGIRCPFLRIHVKLLICFELNLPYVER